jgi:hypothetical protein
VRASSLLAWISGPILGIAAIELAHLFCRLAGTSMGDTMRGILASCAWTGAILISAANVSIESTKEKK